MSSDELGKQYKSALKDEKGLLSYKNINELSSDSDLIFIPLGGTGEIGMNLNLYQYKGKWIMLDCGAGFADGNMPGVDIVVADISFIEKNPKNLLAIVLTHAHEDHCGAVQHLWRKLKVPIYSTNFTINLLKKKMGPILAEKIPMYSIENNGLIDLDPFKLEFIHLTHSIPEMNAVILHTEYGAVMHTGDWKIDNSPVIGDVSNEERLRQISGSEKGVLAMICDSTNVFSPGRSPSESDLQMSIYNIVSSCNEGAVALTLFASNIARIEIVSRIAKELNKKVVILGRALKDIVDAAQESGYLCDYMFYQADAIQKINRKELLILCTGCQGDEFAAINKLSLSTHSSFKLYEGDTVIFSSKIIPGNEKRIANILNRFVKMDVKVITEKTHHVHVSGHPYRDELKHMYEVVRPKILIPVHGEHVHIHEHAKFAMDCGIKNSLILADGDVIRLGPGDAEKIGKVKSGFFCVDGTRLVHPDGELMNMRRKMQKSGIVVVILVVDVRLNLLKKPTLNFIGYVDDAKWEKRVLDALQQEVASASNITKEALAHLMIKTIKRNINKKDKIPHIEVFIEQVDKERVGNRKLF